MTRMPHGKSGILANQALMQARLSSAQLRRELSACNLACIIHVVEGAKSLLCYKHVVKTVFEATKEASA